MVGGGVVVIVAVFGGRGWGGGGCGWCQLRPSGGRGCRGRRVPFPGAVAPRRVPRLQGACPGLGRWCPCRRIPRLRERPRVPFWTSRRVWAAGQAAWICGRSGAPVPQGFAPPRFCALGSPARVGALAVLSVPRACAGGPADDAAGAGPWWRTPCDEYPDRFGTWAQVDHPSAVRAGGGGSRGAAGQWGPVLFGGPGGVGPLCRGWPPTAPGARMRRTPRRRATGGRPSWVLRKR